MKIKGREGRGENREVECGRGVGVPSQVKMAGQDGMDEKAACESGKTGGRRMTYAFTTY